MNIPRRYVDFYGKKRIVRMPMKLSYDKAIYGCASRSSMVTKNRVIARDYCIFNPNSLSNKIRLDETNRAYLNEANRETQPTSKLEHALKDFYFKRTKKSHLLSKNIDKCLSISKYDPDESSKIYGNVVFTFLVDLDIFKPNEMVELLSRVAILYGYSYVADEITEHKNIPFEGSTYRCATVDVQFEAVYFSSNVRVGDKLYHVAPKSITDKILRKKISLTPRNANSYGFNYSPCIYCFIDSGKSIAYRYAVNSNKQSKKFIRKEELAKNIKEFYVELEKKFKLKNDNKEYVGTLFDSKEFCLLEIDTKKLKDVKFYRDNAFEYDGDFIAVYTFDNIPYNAISIVDDFIANRVV